MKTKDEFHNWLLVDLYLFLNFTGNRFVDIFRIILRYLQASQGILFFIWIYSFSKLFRFHYTQTIKQLFNSYNKE